ncbi:MAG TPA: hypothetical protein EYN25_04610 [Candidatus Nitrosopelagicus sp.]|uniref:UPF0201 protein ALOHA_HF4000APKG8I13ctg1g17 n=1 Tax=uncultured marine crenarchaeote HF4000_APKG8I13 TaxID=455606 RepID=B3TAY9_9ARCH|nr:putative protein of unknown function DUF54 [uncultured marine crenarchaeote HF4000_APKG8I13]RZD34812.1 MAG: hypothetical protein CXT79_02105 [Nitrososphaerota archaeon]HIA25948.1 hypothetical protein [Candidatus Nitrosopelagicus sp.]HIF52807.1 hypothetical protein [Candidatus Nitrosopelagicus sp.]HIO32828.1 hypothetical protein [Candidatus Nitrosopelagicus sp.]
MRSLDIDCKISAYCAINPSEDIDKIRTAVSNVLIDMDEKIVGNSLIANSNNYESLSKIYEIIRAKNIKKAYRRNLRQNIVDDSTWFYLNKQAAFANVIALCDEDNQSPLGPIKIVLQSKNIRDVIDWFVPYEE